MAEKHVKLAQEVVKGIGGIGNITMVTNCMTRLRFVLKDVEKANTDAIEAIFGVQGVVNKNGQFQVVIGTDVSFVCDEIKKMGNFNEGNQTSEQTEKTGFISRVLGAITAIFMPVIPAICGAGMIKAVLAICVAAGWLTADASTYKLLSVFADAAFYFLPVILAFSSAKRFNCNPYFAAVLGGILIHPSFVSLLAGEEPVAFLGISVRAVSYGSAVVPPILIVLIQSYVERFANKISPNAVKVFLVPLITFLVMGPLAICLIGPLGSMVGDVLLIFFTFLNEQARWVIPFIMGAFCPFLVMTGMHYSLMPVQLAQYATLGYGTLLGPGMLASNLSQAGACFAVALRSKDKELRSTALSSGITALFGITEPALYGVTMKLKRPLLAVVIGGGAAGLWGGIMNMRTYASASAGLLALPVYISDDMSNVINAIICIIIALVVSFIVTLILGFEDDAKKVTPTLSTDANHDNNDLMNTEEIVAPLLGDVVPLSEVDDEVFSKEIMGKGIAIRPSEGEITSPCAGVVSAIFPTKHAIGITSDQGVEIMIHVGLNTVELEGKPFSINVKEGDRVTVKEQLGTIDLAFIQEKGYDPITPVIITNTKDFMDVLTTSQDNVIRGEYIMTVVK